MMTKPPYFIFIALFYSLVSLDVGAQAIEGKKGATQPKLAPGEYEWHPERSTSGPLLMVVSIDDQVAYVYRNGVQIARSTVSTGKKGHATPDGVFTILQKHKKHVSSIYKGAKMPNMQRLTWQGICMHAGNLPGYPASHGCIRMPLEFSAKLYSITKNGSTVVVTSKAAPPSKSTKPALILLSSTVEPGSKPAAELVGKTLWEPKMSPSGPVNFLLSGSDRTIYVYRNGILIGQSPVSIANPDTPIPYGVFMMLDGIESAVKPSIEGKASRPWTTLSLDSKSISGGVEELRKRLQIPREFGNKIYALAQPGTILLTTAKASTPQTRSKPDFTIMQQDASPEGK